MEPPSASAPGPPSEVPTEAPTGDLQAPARQRWRLVLARSADPPGLAGRDLMDAWESTLEASGLPVFLPLGRARARVAFGAPMPANFAAEHELADIVLTDFVPGWQVREGLADHLPDGWRLVDCYDVWLGGPPLAGQVAAADYRIDLGEADVREISAAAVALLDASELPRERLKGGSAVRYDLRPLLVDVGVADAGPPLLLRARTRFHPVLGTGRPEEVVAAVGERLGQPLVVGSVVRERLILADEMG